MFPRIAAGRCTLTLAHAKRSITPGPTGFIQLTLALMITNLFPILAIINNNLLIGFC